MVRINENITSSELSGVICKGIWTDVLLLTDAP